jgi:hypothetical protein
MTHTTVPKHLLWVILATMGYSVHALVEPTFHLKNNSHHEIKIDIKQSGNSVFKVKPVDLKTIAKGDDFSFLLDIDKPTALEIYQCPTPDFCKENLPQKTIVRFTEGKTIYIKYNGKKVMPQEGSKFKGKTTAGYSTKNNVEQSDISVLSDLKKRKLQD